jgi:serine/threonine protein kinase
LGQLHRLRQSARVGGDESQEQTVWALEPFELEVESCVSDSGGRGEPEQDGAGERDRLGGLVSREGEACRRAGHHEGSESVPDEESPPIGAAPPRRIGKYQVIEMLDSGGQAQVFRGHHPELRKDFVLKLSKRPIAVGTESHAESPTHDPLIDEGRLLAQSDHPGLVRVVDLDVHEDRPFVVMDYVPGLTLEPELIATP